MAIDDWGADPQVRYLRGVFGRIEEAQGEVLRRIGVSPFDYRLKRVREAALKAFEERWMRGAREGLIRTDEEITVLYVHCLARVLAGNRIAVPEEALPAHEKIRKFVEEVLP